MKSGLKLSFWKQRKHNKIKKEYISLDTTQSLSTTLMTQQDDKSIRWQFCPVVVWTFLASGPFTQTHRFGRGESEVASPTPHPAMSLSIWADGSRRLVAGGITQHPGPAALLGKIIDGRSGCQALILLNQFSHEGKCHLANLSIHKVCPISFHLPAYRHSRPILF